MPWHVAVYYIYDPVKCLWLKKKIWRKTWTILKPEDLPHRWQRWSCACKRPSPTRNNDHVGEDNVGDHHQREQWQTWSCRRDNVSIDHVGEDDGDD